VDLTVPFVATLFLAASSSHRQLARCCTLFLSSNPTYLKWIYLGDCWGKWSSEASCHVRLGVWLRSAGDFGLF
jgi:hypothetical protein